MHPTKLYQGWPDFFARGPNLQNKKHCGPQKLSKNFFLLVFLIFSLKQASLRCFPYKMMPINMVVHHNKLLQGPQKIFGGLHAVWPCLLYTLKDVNFFLNWRTVQVCFSEVMERERERVWTRFQDRASSAFLSSLSLQFGKAYNSKCAKIAITQKVCKICL